MLLNRRFSALTRAGAARGRLVVVCTVSSLAALVLCLFPTQASAGLMLPVQNVSAQPGGTGSFDVVLTDTSGTFEVSAFSVELSVPVGSGVTFTGATENTSTAPYIFTTLQVPPITFTDFSTPTNDFTASDSYLSPPGTVSLSAPPTLTLGLEHVTFAVASGTQAGTVPVSIVSGIKTQILDLDGNILLSTPIDGTITVDILATPSPHHW